MDIKNHYDFFGPFQISNGQAFIKNTYVPFDIGSPELSQVIKNQVKKLETELTKWVLLDELNLAEINKKDNNDPSN